MLTNIQKYCREAASPRECQLNSYYILTTIENWIFENSRNIFWASIEIIACIHYITTYVFFCCILSFNKEIVKETFDYNQYFWTIDVNNYMIINFISF